jgi:tellurite resistance protein
MGMAGFSLALARAEQVYSLDMSVSLVVTILTALLFIILSVIYLAKLLKEKTAVIQELHHPIKINFFPSFSISLLLLAIAFLPLHNDVAHGLWITGSIMHLLFTLFVMNAWLNHDFFEVKHMNPAWFIPIVGNILVPIAGTELGYTDISWFYFSIGLVFWPVLLTIIFYRVIFHPALPEKLMPTFFILIAPPAVGFISYIQLNGEVDNFARILYYTGVFFTLLMISQYPRFSRLKFFLSWWAYSFPMAAITIASLIMYQKTQAELYSFLALVFLGLLTAFIGLLIIRTFNAFFNKQICVPD